MKVTKITDFRYNLKEYLDEISDNNEVIIVQRKEGNVVLLSEEEYNKYKKQVGGN